MTLLAESMTAASLVPLDTTVEVLAPALVDNPHLDGVTALHWTPVVVPFTADTTVITADSTLVTADATEHTLDAVVVETVLGSIMPAGTRALERAGRIGKTGVHELCTEPASLVPQGRVRIGARQYAILDVREFVPFVYAIVEEVAA